MMWIVDVALITVSAAVYSAIEIEMEGKHGWAEKLPTAKNVVGRFTLYHLLMMLFVTIVIGAIFLPRLACSCTPWQAALRFVFYLLLWFLVEDFLWFVLNPYYTLARYDKQHVSWHDRWIGDRMPTHNVAGVLGLVLLAFLEGTWTLFGSLVVASGLAVLSCIGAPSYHKFYNTLHLKEKVTQ